jgi:hypothetical protein
MDILKFDTLDLPPDIELISHPETNYFVFHKLTYDLRNDSYFRLQIFGNSVTKCKCDMFGEIGTIEGEQDKEIIDNFIETYGDINHYLWKLSNEKYNIRFIKMELIERIRKITDVNHLKKIIEYLKTNYDDRSDNTDLD